MNYYGENDDYEEEETSENWFSVPEVPSGEKFVHENDMVKAKKPESDYSMADLASLIHVVNNKVDVLLRRMNDLETKADLRKKRKSRTLINRCQHRNRMDEPCRSYVCTRSQFLCHAHHTLYNVSEQPYLYGQKKIKIV